MPGQAAKVVITEKQQAILQEFANSRTESLALIQRSKIILLAFAKQRNEDIAPVVDLNRNQVGVWRKRWQEAWAELTSYECHDARKLREAIRDLLSDAPRAGRSSRFTAVQVTQLIALACELPKLSNRPITHWTQIELCKEAIQRGIVDTISPTHMGRLLRRSALQPHRQRMWLNTTEKDPVLFEQQVKQVCETYQQAHERYERDGTRTVCIDEMTGIQALERAAPDKPMRCGSVAKQEFEYIRHGTTTLIGNFDVVSGEMFACTIGPTRTEEDFVAHIQQTVASDATANWEFIVDNLNTHCSAGLVEYIAKLCEPKTELGKKRRIRHSEKHGESSRVSRRTVAPRAVRVHAEA